LTNEKHGHICNSLDRPRVNDQLWGTLYFDLNPYK